MPPLSLTLKIVVDYREVVQRLVKMDLRLAVVHLVDAHYCSDPGKFISGITFFIFL